MSFLNCTIALKLYPIYPPLAAVWLFLPSVMHEQSKRKENALISAHEKYKQATEESQIKN